MLYMIGDTVEDTTTRERGNVVYMWEGNVRVRFDDDRTSDYLAAGNDIRRVESAPASSYVADVVHEAMLRHARNAGAAVTALEIIRREAKTALDWDGDPTNKPLSDTLNFIEKFAGDVLSQVLPA